MRTSGNIFNKSPLGLILSMHNWHGIVGVVRVVWTISAGTSSRVNTMARKWWKAERWFYLSGKWKLVDPDPEKGIKSFQCHIQRPGLRLLANVSEDWCSDWCKSETCSASVYYFPIMRMWWNLIDLEWGVGVSAFICHQMMDFRLRERVDRISPWALQRENMSVGASTFLTNSGFKVWEYQVFVSIKSFNSKISNYSYEFVI